MAFLKIIMRLKNKQGHLKTVTNVIAILPSATL